MKKKKCSKCRRTKEIKLFSKNASMSDGLSHYCKNCNRKRLAEYFQTKAGQAAIKRATLKRKKARKTTSKKKSVKTVSKKKKK